MRGPLAAQLLLNQEEGEAGRVEAGRRAVGVGRELLLSTDPAWMNKAAGG